MTGADIAITTGTTIDEARAWAQRWDRVPAAGSSDIFTCSVWCLAAWRAFPDLGTPTLLVATDQASGLRAVLPLTDGPEGPTWPASPLGDEHDLRVTPGRHAPIVAEALLRYVSQATPTASASQLGDVRPDGVLAGLAQTRRGCPAPVVHLQAPDHEFGMIACLPGWSRKQRRAPRSTHRHLQGLGQVTTDLVIDPGALAHAIPDFVAARLVAWRRRGRFDELPIMDRQPAFPQFLAEVGAGLAAAGGRCALMRLMLDGTPVAQSLFFRTPGTYLLYMSTYDQNLARFSPSHLLLAEAAQLAVNEGVRTIEMGRGDEPYKHTLGATSRHLVDVVLPR